MRRDNPRNFATAAVVSQRCSRSTAIRRNSFAYRLLRLVSTCSSFTCKVCLIRMSQVKGSVQPKGVGFSSIAHRDRAAGRTHTRSLWIMVGCQGRLDAGARIRSAGRRQGWLVGACLPPSKRGRSCQCCLLVQSCGPARLARVKAQKVSGNSPRTSPRMLKQEFFDIQL